MTISKRIRDERKALRLSQEALARKAGLSQGAISQMEGNPNQGSKYLIQIAKALNVSPEWLESGLGQKNVGVLSHDQRISESVQLLQSLDDAGLDQVLGLLRLLSNHSPSGASRTTTPVEKASHVLYKYTVPQSDAEDDDDLENGGNRRGGTGKNNQQR